MRVLIWIAAILVLLIALLVLTRLRLTGVYGEEGASLTVRLGALPLLRIPRQEKPADAPAKTGQKKEKKKKEDKKENTAGGSEPGFRRDLQIIGRLLGKIKRRLTIDELTLWYLSAGDDPAATALIFGAANAAAAALAKAVESLFRVKKRDISAAVSFTEQKPKVYAKLRLSISLGVLLWLLGKAYLTRQWARLAAARK